MHSQLLMPQCFNAGSNAAWIEPRDTSSESGYIPLRCGPFIHVCV